MDRPRRGEQSPRSAIRCREESELAVLRRTAGEGADRARISSPELKSALFGNKPGEVTLAST